MKIAIWLFLWAAMMLPVQAEAPYEKDFLSWCQRNQVEQAALLLSGPGTPTRYVFFGKATATTPFLLGSLTKSMTALLVAQQIEQGNLHLDDPVRQILPYWKMADPALSQQVTIRHLLTHSSGLPKSAGNRRYNGGLEAGVKSLAEVTAVAPPGQKHEYSNANYMVLGCVLESLTQQTYPELLQKRILEPLGMNLSSPGIFLGRAFETACFMPSGGLVSAPEDMSLYVQSQLGQGRRLLSSDLDLHRELIAGLQYGFGWYCDAAGSWANHSGEVFVGPKTYHSFVGLHLKAGKGFAVLSRMPRSAPTPGWHDLEAQLWKDF